MTILRAIVIGWLLSCTVSFYQVLKDIEHDLNVIAIEQIKIEHQDNVENQSAYVRK